MRKNAARRAQDHHGDKVETVGRDGAWLKIHEVRTASYGFAMTNVRITTKPGGEAYKLNAFVLALPGANDSWSVIGASYGALF
jgi:hypothetical protein